MTGASITGPAIAYWLARQGNEVVVVERAPEFRDGGQTIDVRGAGRTVVQRMGLEDAVRARSTSEDGIAFVDHNNVTKAEIGARPSAVRGQLPNWRSCAASWGGS